MRSSWWLLLVLNFPLLEEVIRKYFIYSDLVFLAADGLAVLTAVLLLFGGRLMGGVIPRSFWLLSLLFVLFAGFLNIYQGLNAGIFGVGFRATYLPIVYLMIGGSYLSMHSNGPDKIFLCVVFWILIAGAMVFTQLALGQSHAINSIWGQAGLGIGDYTTPDEGVLLSGLFRPTSIFTHTGKFGQAIFTLVLYKWVFMAVSGKRYAKIFYVLILFDLAVVFASGQRAAVIFLVLAAVMVFANYFRMLASKISRPLSILMLLFVGFIALIAVYPEVAGAIFTRFLSAGDAVPIRIIGNFFLPFGSMLENHLVIGEGFGFFTFGASMFGGAIVYEHLDLAGLGESSFIRICGEVGVLGAFLLFASFLSLIRLSMARYKPNMGTPVGAACLFYFTWTVCILLWSNTADILANSVVTTLGYALSGGLLARRKAAKSKKGLGYPGLKGDSKHELGTKS